MDNSKIQLEELGNSLLQTEKDLNDTSQRLNML